MGRFVELKLYRLTSNHHTDLPKIFSFLIILIGIFATILFVRENLNILLEVKVIRGILGVAFIVYLIYTYETITSFNFFTLLSYIPCFWLLGDNPKYIFGVASLFTNENKNGAFLNFAFSIYTILFILLIFSLQKTARKNSIIPS